MNLIQTHATGGDCTAPYKVVEFMPTVKEFIDEVFSERPKGEWGIIKIVDKDNVPNKIAEAEYRNGCFVGFTKEKIEPYFDREIEEISAAGGWGSMDYFVELKETMVKMPISAYKKLQMKIQDLTIENEKVWKINRELKDWVNAHTTCETKIREDETTT